MSLALAQSQLIAGSAGSASAVVYTLFGDEISGTPATDAFQVLGQGYLPVTTAALYTVGAGKQALVKRVLLANVTAGAVAVSFFINGTGAANRSSSFTVPANGSAEWTEQGWVVLDSTGNRLTAAGVGPAGPKGMTFRGAWSGATAYATDDVVTTADGSYIALQAHTNQAPPTWPTAANAYWSAIALRGPTGSTGSQGPPGEVTTAAMQAYAQPLDADLTAIAALATTAFGRGFLDLADATAARTKTGAQAQDADLDAIAALTTTAFGRGQLAYADAAAATAALDVATASTKGLLAAADKRVIDSLHYDAVADFGWVGNDSTDNLSLWAATKAGLPTGAVLFFPAGTYRVSGELTIDVDKRISFRGVSRYSSIIKTTSATANIFHKSVAGWYDSFADLGFQSTVTKTAGSAIHISAGNNVGMNCYRLWITGLFKGISAIGNQSANLSVWSDLDISGIPNGGRGLHIDGATINVMIHNATVNGGAATTSACCEINQSGAVQVTGCDWIQGTNVLLLNSNAGAGPQAVYFTNCFFDQPAGSVVKIVGTNTANRIKFTQCGIAPTGNNHAVEINGTGAGAVGTATALPAGISLVDCDIYSANGTNTGAGVLLNGVQDVNVQNCRIAGFNGAGGAAISVIPSAGNQTKLRVNGCILGPNSNLTVTNETGVKLVAGASALGFLSITDNSMIGCATAISDASTTLNTSPKNINNNQGAVGGFSAQAVPLSTVLTTVETVVMVVPLPPNSVKVGTSFKLILNYKPALASIGTVRFRIGTSDVTPATNTAVAAVADTVTTGNANAKFGSMEGAITAVGGAAAFIGNGFFVNTAAALNHSQNAAASGSFNSAVQNYLMVTIQNGTSTTTTVYNGTLEVISPS